MLRHGLEQKPNECCGLLGADYGNSVLVLNLGWFPYEHHKSYED